MGTFSVEIKGLEKLNESLSLNPLRSTLRLRLLKTITEFQEEIKRSTQKHYSILRNIDKVTERELLRNSSKNIIAVQLRYRYERVPLSAYPVLQQRVTVGKQTLRVSRFKQGTFKKEIVPDEVYFTFVKIKKDWKLVIGKHGPDKKGRPGYMGWLHTGGLSGRFTSSGIFERAQQATWRDGVRLPVFELYGPSFTQIVNSPEVVADARESKAVSDFLKYIEKKKL